MPCESLLGVDVMAVKTLLARGMSVVMVGGQRFSIYFLAVA